jgi:hypothetical protein
MVRNLSSATAVGFTIAGLAWLLTGRDRRATA